MSSANQGQTQSNIESLFLPGLLLTQEADNLMQLVRNCGARLNRLKLARAAPDAPMWWQFLASPDGSAESLDRVASELQRTLRELEHTNSELKRLCVAPATDVAGNVQREMEKKKWAIGTLDRWSAVLKNVASDRAVMGKEKKRTRKIQQQQQSNSMQDPDEQTSIQDDNSSLLCEEIVGESQQKNEDKLSVVKAKFPMEITQRKHDMIQDCVASMDRIEHLQDELEMAESKCTSALKLSQKFRELELLETRFANVRTRRKQFQNQVENHLKGIGTEIEKEARMRTQNAREYYDEQYIKEYSHRQHADPYDNNNINNSENTHHNHNEGGENNSSCSRCPFFDDEIDRLKNVRRSNWVDRAVRILCTQAVTSTTATTATNTNNSIHEVPTHRILALVGSDKTTNKPIVLRPLFSKRITKPTPGEEERRRRDTKTASSQMMTFDVPASLVVTMKDGEDPENSSSHQREKDRQAVANAELGCAGTVEWKIPSANDHTKHWKVRLNVQ